MSGDYTKETFTAKRKAIVRQIAELHRQIEELDEKTQYETNEKMLADQKAAEEKALLDQQEQQRFASEQQMAEKKSKAAKRRRNRNKKLAEQPTAKPTTSVRRPVGSKMVVDGHEFVFGKVADDASGSPSRFTWLAY
jgi:septum formation inhibitor MinC